MGGHSDGPVTRRAARLARLTRPARAADAAAMSTKRWEWCCGVLALCCACGEPVLAGAEDTVAFDATRGGVLCLAHERGALRLPAAVVAAAQQLAAGADPGPLESAPADERRALRDLTREALRAHLRRPLKSMAFFAALPQRAAEPREQQPNQQPDPQPEPQPEPEEPQPGADAVAGAAGEDGDG